MANSADLVRQYLRTWRSRLARRLSSAAVRRALLGCAHSGEETALIERTLRILAADGVTDPHELAHAVAVELSIHRATSAARAQHPSA
jgi:hypothetical protein